MPVEALFDPGAAQEAALRNLLQRHGYAGLDAVRAEAVARGKAQGKAEGELEALRRAILKVLESRGFGVDVDVSRAVLAAVDRDLLTL